MCASLNRKAPEEEGRKKKRSKREFLPCSYSLIRTLVRSFQFSTLIERLCVEQTKLTWETISPFHFNRFRVLFYCLTICRSSKFTLSCRRFDTLENIYLSAQQNSRNRVDAFERTKGRTKRRKKQKSSNCDAKEICSNNKRFSLFSCQFFDCNARIGAREKRQKLSDAGNKIGILLKTWNEKFFISQTKRKNIISFCCAREIRSSCCCFDEFFAWKSNRMLRNRTLKNRLVNATTTIKSTKAETIFRWFILAMIYSHYWRYKKWNIFYSVHYWHRQKNK